VNSNPYGQQSGYATDDVGLRASVVSSVGFLTQAFTWMFLGLLLSAFVAYLVENSFSLADTVMNLWLPLIIAEMVIGVGLQVMIKRINATAALGLFLIYAGLNGLTFGVILLAYTYQQGGTATVVEAFLSAAAMFGGAAMYGAVTHRSLTNMFGYLAMATWGLLVAILLNLLLNNSMLDMLISVVGVIIFTALTASVFAFAPAPKTNS
jgi:FtsH-binding integral membrane protein